MKFLQRYMANKWEETNLVDKTDDDVSEKICENMQRTENVLENGWEERGMNHFPRCPRDAPSVPQKE